MESAQLATDNLRNTMATLDAMTIANKELKKTYGKIDLDKIDRLHDEMEDLLERAQEVQETIGQGLNYGVPDEVDEADLEAELEALALEPEVEESPGYLADLNKAPDFIDEPPVEERTPVAQAVKAT